MVLESRFHLTTLITICTNRHTRRTLSNLPTDQPERTHMKTLPELLQCSGCATRSIYVRNVLLLAIGKASIDLLVMPLRPDLFATWSWGSTWLNPFLLIDPWLDGAVPLIVCLSTFVFYTGLVWNSVHRARHAGIPHWAGLFTAVPFLNTLTLVILLVAPAGKRPSVLDMPRRW